MLWIEAGPSTWVSTNSVIPLIVLKASDFHLHLFAKPTNVFSVWLFTPSPFSCSGGGFHHCSSDKGGGFCAYADITLAIKVRTALKPLFSAVCANGGEIHINSQELIYILIGENEAISRWAGVGIWRVVKWKRRAAGVRIINVNVHYYNCIDNVVLQKPLQSRQMGF